ncbi:hypothetical protein ALT_9459 [Aspergillus lentulus]|uniref:Uncharacterized protein n=1 Tax=Aspergillus lentulus TaxID=293939 RepID=A0AAN4TEP5_ASPLE|nr:hypothetical protein ALT_9459 [Aspergillus lentulus]
MRCTRAQYVEDFIIGFSKLNGWKRAPTSGTEPGAQPLQGSAYSNIPYSGGNDKVGILCPDVQATQATEINVKTTEQGPRILDNAISTTMLVIQQFFSGEQ